MEKIFENKHFVVHFDAENNMYIEEWKEASTEKTSQEWYEDHKIVKDLLMKYKPKLFLSYSDKTYYPVSPEMQEWYKENIVNKVASFIKKAAVVMPKEFIARLSLEQLVSEVISATGKKMTIKLFDNRQEAKNWLLKK